MLLKEVLYFLKKPVYQVDENTDLKYRFGIFKNLLLYSLLFSFVLGVLLALLENGFDLDLGQHAVDTFLSKYPPMFLLFVAVFLAPLIEEIFFRGPLIFFKGHRSFPYCVLSDYPDFWVRASFQFQDQYHDHFAIAPIGSASIMRRADFGLYQGAFRTFMVHWPARML